MARANEFITLLCLDFNLDNAESTEIGVNELCCAYRFIQYIENLLDVSFTEITRLNQAKVRFLVKIEFRQIGCKNIIKF